MQRENEVQHVFLVGAKSLGAYGGYETFVYKLTEYHQNKTNIKYHVVCKANGVLFFNHNITPGKKQTSIRVIPEYTKSRPGKEKTSFSGQDRIFINMGFRE